MIKCSECGYENMDGLDYCDGCGVKLEGAAHSHAPAPASAPAQTGSATAAAEPTSVNEMAAVESSAAAEAGTSAPSTEHSGASSEPAASNESAAVVAEPTPAQATTGEMKTTAAAPVTGAEAAATPFKAKLSIIRGGRRGQEFELESGNNLVGRWDPDTGAFPEVDLDADDPEAKVSRKHALIRIDAGKITIEDIGSLNGTYVNRQPRLQPGTPLDLKDGDEIIIGKTFLKLAISPIS
jgi:predicted component of type VI protein secretion system